MKRKVKNNREEYVSRVSLRHPKSEQSQCDETVETKTTEPDRYSQAVIEEDWYINFRIVDKKA